jgi:hypothetical protein
MANVTPGIQFVSGETVTPAKLNAAATPTVVVANGEVTTARLADGAVTNVKVASGLDASKLTTGTLPADRIGTEAITAARLAPAAVEAAKLAPAAVTPAAMSGGQSGAAPVFGVRAWVNFDGDFTNRTGNAYSRSGTTVTVTRAAHGLATGNKLVIASATDAALNTATNTASQEITVVDANTFTFTTAATGATTGTLAFRLGIRASGNVASVARNNSGRYSVTFATDMPDTSYAVTGGGHVSSISNLVQRTLTVATASVTTSGFECSLSDATNNNYEDAEVHAIVIR